MNDYEGKDGLARDYAKLRALGVPWRSSMLPHWERFRSAHGIVDKFHTFTNLLTEGCRASPYYFAHVIVWPLIITNVVLGAMVFHFLVKP